MRLVWMKSDYVLPPDTGGKIRTYNLMRELNSLCNLTYLAFKNNATPNDEPEISQCAAEVITEHKPEENKSGLEFYARVLSGMSSRLPYIVQKYRSKTIREHQRQFVNQDQKSAVVLCDFLEMAENVDWSLPCPKVLFQHNVESQIWNRYYQTEQNPLKRAYFNFERRRMTEYEAATCNRFDLVFTVSDEDKTKLRDEMGVTTPIVVLETGVDTEFFQPIPDRPPTPGRLVFLGSMDWMPNIDGMKWFVDQIYPQIKSAWPEVSLDIVGRRPGAEIHQLAERDASIRILADVPDVRPHIAACELFIVPLRIGGGSRIKIYEAMAMDRPVVSTTIGAEGLPLTPGRDIAIGDSPKEYAEQVVQLLKDHSQRESISKAGYQLVTQNYQWKNVALRLRDHCEELVQSHD